MDTSAETDTKTMTLEAFADTFVPGEKRSPDDVAIAGAAHGAGAVVAGAIELLEMPATGIASGLDEIVATLNDHASSYAAEHHAAAFVRIGFLAMASDGGVVRLLNLQHEMNC